jgi:rhamnulokinase
VTITSLEELVGNPIEVIHIVGGGSQNQLLNQFAANACNLPVLAGPVETTILGNVLVQARSSGEAVNLSELRAIVRDSFEVRSFEPEGKTADDWAAARQRFAKLTVAG